ncbi:hypothetical protein [Pseudodesulfovibrio sediminis]|uniref:Uncharacterized protein n=1 Tax=Pseudodesulfovibrio sediminis TaxID=2810563 RepID=A0ABN6EUR8_9BACT|nr:hypothetical protein [Pseudodesulfovibrio sediminis]BCS88945.1 hypothetical protein PSDVSF_21870 [Pseudodesulfovibrio sediminis]
MRILLAIAFVFVILVVPALAQENTRPACLEDTVAFYNCMKGGTELQRNLATTYLLGSIHALDALELVDVPSSKSMRHLRFEYLDYVEMNASIHKETPWRGMAMYLLNTYGDSENTAGLEYAGSIGLLK